MTDKKTTEIELTDEQWTAVSKALRVAEGLDGIDKLTDVEQAKLRDAMHQIDTVEWVE